MKLMPKMMALPSIHVSYCVFSVLFYLLLLFVSTCGKFSSYKLSSNKPTFQYKYYQDGDIMIGGIFSVNSLMAAMQSYEFLQPRLFCTIPNVENYVDLMSFIFAVNEINQKSDLLPNITLGYHLYDTCGDLIQSVQGVLAILSGGQEEVPNYSCREHGEVAGFVGDTVPMAQLLGIYGYSKISYDFPDPMSSNSDLYNTFFTTVHKNNFRYLAISHVIRKFGWNWVGILTPFDNSGEEEAQKLSKELNLLGICVAYIIKLSREFLNNVEKCKIIERSRACVIIICGKFFLHYGFLKYLDVVRGNITLILHDSWSYGYHLEDIFLQTINCSLVISPPEYDIPGLERFLNSINVDNRPSDPILEDTWYYYFSCFIPNLQKLFAFQSVYNIPLHNCTGRRYNIASVLAKPKNPSFYLVYTAVYILAYALRDMIANNKGSHHGFTNKNYRKQLQRYIRNVHYRDHTGQTITFNTHGELSLPMSLYNWIFYYGESGKIFTSNIIGDVQYSEIENRYNVHMNETAIRWKTSEIPQSRCNEKCSPGFTKVSKPQNRACCYDCVACSEGEMSNLTDSEVCHRCPDDQWPDEKKVDCVPKPYEFLSYKDDDIVIFFIFTSLLFSIITLFILGIFIHFWDTPIVRANNRTVSFILLVFILLSFLCVFFFLGRPVDITCMLRQILFGIFFSISVSSVLSKTITVCIAFKATRPGSVWRKWVGLKTSNYVVVICSSVQVLICLGWLSVSPPYQDFDMTSYPEKIIIQCNEGSDLWFYSMLGYMGLLAAVSFLLAFMVRTLPDSFNEAKYITFSMLLFCSVWMSMIPAYLSTRGKYMVAMEVFAILASGAGLLCCFFFPKCYMMLIKEEINIKR